MASKDQINLC